MHDSVTVTIAASPLAVWELISDVTQTGKYSPETFEAEWLGGATGPSVGAKFRGHVNRNNKGVKYWTVCAVTESTPGEVFAFDVEVGSKVANSWKYELAPNGAGVDVTESFRIPDSAATRLYWKIAGKARGRVNRANMQTTLERIKAVAEA